MPLGTDSVKGETVEGADGVERQVNGEVQDVYTDEQLVAQIRAETEKQEGMGLSLDEAIKKAHERGINVREIAETAGWTQDAVRKLVADKKTT